MLSSLRQSLFNPLCIHCGSYFVQEHLFCHFCFENYIEAELFLKASPAAELKHLFLLNWNPGQSDVISEMVYRFKGQRCLLAWKFYAEKVAEALAQQKDILSYEAIVPLPGSKPSSVHAIHFAQNLSRHLGLPVLNILTKRPDTGAQKTKTAQERRQNQGPSGIQRLEQFTKEDLAELKIIYVDDIMTTGETYKRSKEAIGNGAESLLVTLFYRAKQV